MLRHLGFEVDLECIRIQNETDTETTATVKVEDASFAKRLSRELVERASTVRALPIPVHNQPTNCRKIYISWHRPTRDVWVTLENDNIASRVVRRFNEGRYKCLGLSSKACLARDQPSGQMPDGIPFHLRAFVVHLSGVSSAATSADISRAIRYPNDQPSDINIGKANYEASEAEVSVEVRSVLERHGPLENFHLNLTHMGKRAKASAWFQDEADARSSSALNKEALDILGGGRLTITLVHSTRVKIPTAVYHAWKSHIQDENKTWKDEHLSFHTYVSALSTILKVEGDNADAVVKAKKTLKRVATGVAIVYNGKPLWAPGLNANGPPYQKLKVIEGNLQVVIRRIRSKGQLLFFGPPEKLKLAETQISDMLADEVGSYEEVRLEPHLFSWMIRGRHQAIEEELGRDVAVVNMVTRTITIHGNREQRKEVLAMMDGERVLDALLSAENGLGREGHCPICFCEAKNPVETSCNHTYCVECFEDYCKTAASTSEDNFKIKCQGDRGACSTIFTLHELKDNLPSSILETVLESSFREYVKRHPQALRYCPTADCGFIYRCSPASDLNPVTHTCPNCSEQVCTSCHAQHGDYTCAEHEDMNSGEGLKDLKRELEIKDCPKCTTPLEKIEGCNHMTCGGCRAHICWVCLEVFEHSEECYGHMSKEHGGIGLEDDPEDDGFEDE